MERKGDPQTTGSVSTARWSSPTSAGRAFRAIPRAARSCGSGPRSAVLSVEHPNQQRRQGHSYAGADQGRRAPLSGTPW